MLLDGGLYEPLAYSSPDTFRVITVQQGEAGFICEGYHTLLLSIPTLMVVEEGPEGKAMKLH